MINKATLLGRVGKKETKTLQNGTELTILSIATNRKWLDKNGQKQESTSWHNVNCFNKLAEIGQKYAHVGDLIYIEGEIQNKKSVGNDGVEKWFYSITASQLQLIPTGKKQENNESTDSLKDSNSDFFDDSSDIPF